MKTIVRYTLIAMKDPTNYEARANLMWTSSWAINGFVNGGKQQAWSCHPMEHELSAIYDITHGLGLAIDYPPVLAEGFDAPLEEGMVIALEPKIGIPGFGMVGLEDTFEVTKTGARVLTRSTPEGQMIFLDN